MQVRPGKNISFNIYADRSGNLWSLFISRFRVKNYEIFFITKTQNIEITKIIFYSFRVFVLSCFRDYFIFFGSGFSASGI